MFPRIKILRNSLLVLPLLFVLACGSDNVTDPGGGGGGGGDIAGLSASLKTLQANYLETNEETGNSVGFFLPFLSDLLGAASPFETSALQVSCFADSVQGVTFGFDEGLQSYVPTAASGAPTGGVRLLLYPVDSLGVADFTSSSGHIDITCDIDGGATTGTASIVTNGFEVINLTATSTAASQISNASLTGYIKAIGQPGQLDISGSYTPVGLDGSVFVTNFSMTEVSGFSALASTTLDPSALSWDEAYTATQVSGETVSALQIVLGADLLGDIDGGFVLFDDGGGEKHIGCVSGNLDNSSYQNVTDGQCVFEGATVADATEEELVLIAEGQDILRGLQEFLMEMLVSALGVIPSA